MMLNRLKLKDNSRIATVGDRFTKFITTDTEICLSVYLGPQNMFNDFLCTRAITKW